MSSRKFDIVVYGATGFTGQLVAEYLAARYNGDAGLKWAMAGRSQDKLAAVRDAIGAPKDLPLIVADAGDPASLKAMVDSPAWRLVKALGTLVSDDGNTIMIDNYPVPPPISDEHKAMVVAASPESSDEVMKKAYGVQHWIDDLSYQQAQQRLVSQPTVNIEGLVGGYTGPGGKTILPHRAVAKLDLRLVPGMKFDDAVAALKAHLAKRGYGDIEVNVTGGYNPTQSAADSELIQAQLRVLRARGIEPLLWPRSAGSYPGFVFTDPPLSLASAHYGMGYGTGAHAPDEYFLIESAAGSAGNEITLTSSTTDEEVEGMMRLVISVFDVAPEVSFYDPTSGEKLMVVPAFEAADLPRCAVARHPKARPATLAVQAFPRAQTLPNMY